MGQFTKKPVTVEAVQFRGDVGAEEIVALDLACRHDSKLGVDVLDIPTLEGVMTACPGDWIIRGVKGELYPCKPDIFEATYAPAADFDRPLSFGDAIEALKAGHRVAREGWNGKGMWLALSGVPGGRLVEADKFWSIHNEDFARASGGSAVVLPCITMKTATGEILMGWLASQTDMLAEDWTIVPPRVAFDAAA